LRQFGQQIKQKWAVEVGGQPILILQLATGFAAEAATDWFCWENLTAETMDVP